MDPRFANAPQSYQAPSQRSRESGQQEHLSDFFPNNSPFCLLIEPFRMSLQQDLVWYEQAIMLEENEENNGVTRNVSVTKFECQVLSGGDNRLADNQ